MQNFAQPVHPTKHRNPDIPTAINSILGNTHAREQRNQEYLTNYEDSLRPSALPSSIGSDVYQILQENKINPFGF